MKKLITLSAALAMAVSLCACGAESSSSESVKTETTTVAEKLSPADQLLEDVKGTYDELFTVICDPKYDQVWLDNCEKFVGKDIAESTAKMLKNACIYCLKKHFLRGVPEEVLFYWRLFLKKSLKTESRLRN